MQINHQDIGSVVFFIMGKQGNGWTVFYKTFYGEKKIHKFYLHQMFQQSLMLLQIGETVEVKHPETGRVMEAVIKHMSDSSMYTVGM